MHPRKFYFEACLNANIEAIALSSYDILPEWGKYVNVREEFAYTTENLLKRNHSTINIQPFLILWKHLSNNVNDLGKFIKLKTVKKTTSEWTKHLMREYVGENYLDLNVFKNI